ncbi:terminase small subunit [Paenibacillus filicis]|uniref:Terminase small subunit n=1 Tax=Paenibacillus filicis TaxID=669464 RepID=A0ABU9DII7_9BACL
MSHDWEAIQREYETTEATLAEVAERHGLKLPTIKSRKQRQGWAKGKDASPAKKVASKRASKDAPEDAKMHPLKMDADDDSGGSETRALTPKQEMFVAEFLVDLNATRAAIRAGYSERNADKIGSELLGKTRVRAAIDKAKLERQQRTKITADMVLQRWWDIASADPNELMHLRRVCCRYCFGTNHEFQWINESEYKEYSSAEIAKAKEEDRTPVMPSNEGGYGFDGTLRPHPKCPRCFGEGRVDLHLVDTKQASPQGRVLYAGVKQTQTGIEIRTRDQDKAMELIARHLGMFDQHRQRMDEKKLEILKAKLEHDMKSGEFGETDNGTIDSLMDAIQRSAYAIKERESDGLPDVRGKDDPVHPQSD